MNKRQYIKQLITIDTNPNLKLIPKQVGKTIDPVEAKKIADEAVKTMSSIEYMKAKERMENRK